MKYKTPHYLGCPPGGGGPVRLMHNSNTGNVFGNANVEIKLNSINSSKVKGTIQIPVNKDTTKSHAGHMFTEDNIDCQNSYNILQRINNHSLQL